MKKDRFEFRFAETDWVVDMGAKYAVMVFELDGGYQYDGHITGEYPELDDIEGLYEEMEGTLTYDGEMSLEELKETVSNLGFAVADYVE